MHMKPLPGTVRGGVCGFRLSECCGVTPFIRAAWILYLRIRSSTEDNNHSADSVPTCPTKDYSLQNIARKIWIDEKTERIPFLGEDHGSNAIIYGHSPFIYHFFVMEFSVC